MSGTVNFHGSNEQDSTTTLIDVLLNEQRSLTAVTAFARRHDEGLPPDQARYYRDLVPLDAPRPGEQYGFEVDLDKCTGCKACVAACHSLNGLDDEESWRNIGLLADSTNDLALQQTVTTACHHCVDPGCLNGCPVLAYEKDPITGIVHHLDDQCIGCQYCVMKCPYDVPKYSKRLGIVRKCDLCHQRLADGEAPACVQSCPNEAIRVTLIHRDEISARYRQPELADRHGLASPDFCELAASAPDATFDFARVNNFLPDSPDPAHTLPTTRYVTKQPSVATLRRASRAVLKPEHAHWPLVFMLVFTQLSVGLMTVIALLGDHGDAMPLIRRGVPLAAFTGFLALGVASLHLGQPLKAWRAFLGWRTSWFSREVIVFGTYAGLLTAALAGPWLLDDRLNRMIHHAAAVTGLVGVFCSVMIYADTRREFWNLRRAFGRFIGTTAVVGVLTAAALTSPNSVLFQQLLLLVMSWAPLKLAIELEVLKNRNDPDWTALKRTALLQLGQKSTVIKMRLVAVGLGGFLLPLLLLTGVLPAGPFALSLMLLLVVSGELAERYLFFTTVSPTRMPGGICS